MSLTDFLGGSSRELMTGTQRWELERWRYRREARLFQESWQRFADAVTEAVPRLYEAESPIYKSIMRRDRR